MDDFGADQDPGSFLWQAQGRKRNTWRRWPIPGAGDNTNITKKKDTEKNRNQLNQHINMNYMEFQSCFWGKNPSESPYLFRDLICQAVPQLSNLPTNPTQPGPKPGWSVKVLKLRTALGSGKGAAVESCFRVGSSHNLSGGNSNIFDVHPDPWKNDSI